jgi:hypothetical protein
MPYLLASAAPNRGPFSTAALPLIIHKMGQMIFLTVDRIRFGVDKLLEFVSDRAAVESRRPPNPPGGAIATHPVAAGRFDDGTTFQLSICSLPPASAARSLRPVTQQLFAKLAGLPLNLLSKMKDLEIEMIWHFAEPIPPELLFPSGDRPNPKLDKFLQNAQGWTLRVDVCEVCYPWIKAEKDPELRKIRSSLDGYAQPRLILPESDAESFREDFIALIAMFAAKAQCLGPKDDQLPEFFRSYCDQFCGGVRERRKLSQGDWYGVVDVVFRRLYCGTAGKGFTMPVLAPSFRSYVRQAIRYQAVTATSGIRPIPKPGRFSASIMQAAANLGVSHMTVRRHMKRLHFREWTKEAWTAVSAELAPKKRWQALTDQLQKLGLEKEAARKRVQRCKKSGLTPDEAWMRNSPKRPKGTCKACGEEQAPGGLFQGNFYCRDCYKDKTRRFPED